MELHSQHRRVVSHVDIVDPTMSDNESNGFGIGDIWINTEAMSLFMCGHSDADYGIWKRYDNYLYGGNMSAADAKIGLTSNYSLKIITNDATRIYVENTGEISFGGDAEFAPESVMHVRPLTAGSNGVIIQGLAAQTANLMTIRSDTNLNYLTIGATGALIHSTSVPEYGATFSNIGNGVHITAIDIPLHIGNHDDSAVVAEFENGGHVVFGASYSNTLSSNSVVYGVDNQHGVASTNADFNTQHGAYRIAGKILTEVVERELTTPKTTISSIYMGVDTALDNAPTAGVYLITFSGATECNEPGTIGSVALYVGGVILTRTERKTNVAYGTIHTQARVVLNGADVISVMYKNTGTGTFTITTGSICIQRIQ
jgi:hypothetical protein